MRHNLDTPVSGRVAVLLGVGAFVIAFAAFWIPPTARHWKDVALGLDSFAYMNIGVQVARGNGLAEDNSDTALIALSQQRTFVTPSLQGHDGIVASTRWPPLWPLIMGGVFRSWAYSLDAARTINCVFMALTCALLGGVLARRHGLLSALIFVTIFVLVDDRVRDNARALMTEPLAAILCSLSAILFVEFARSRKILIAAAAGVTIGLAILARSVVFLWLPGLVVLVTWLAVRGRAKPTAVLTAAGVFAATTLLVCLPWFVHNIRALQAFMPLGSHGYTLPSGFSDQAWTNRGVWYSLGDEFFASVVTPGDSALVVARKKAAYGQHQALVWIASHPLKAMILALLKAKTLWVPNASIEMTYLLFPLLGFVALLHRDEAWVFGAFLFLNTVAVAATWTWEADRFQVPLIGLLHYAGALGIRSAVTPLVAQMWPLAGERTDQAHQAGTKSR